MLNRSKRMITYEIIEELKDFLEGVFNIIDESLDKKYYMVFSLVYLNPEKLQLEQLAKRCYMSKHKLIDEITIINKIIQNAYIFCMTHQNFFKKLREIKI